MGFLASILIGLAVGLLARWIMPGRDPMGFILSALLGIIGSWLGSWVGFKIGLYHQGEPAGFFMSLVGALTLLLIYRLLQPRGSPSAQGLKPHV